MNYTIEKILLVSLVSNNLLNYGRRHFKLFMNCHVSHFLRISDMKLIDNIFLLYKPTFIQSY